MSLALPMGSAAVTLITLVVMPGARLEYQPADSSYPSPSDPLADLLAFAKLYRHTRGRLYAIALALLRQQDAAEDVLQETYLAVWRTAGQLQIGDRAYSRGDYHAALPGARHTPISTRNGGVVFIRGQLRPEMLR